MKELLSLNKYLKSYWFTILVGIGCVILSNYFAIFVPVFVRQGFDDAQFHVTWLQTLSSNAVFQFILWNSLGFGAAIFIASFLKGVFMYFMRQTLVVVSRNIEFDQKNELFQKYERLGEAFYRENYTGDLMSRITEDISNVRMYIGPAIMYFTNVLFSFIMIVGQMFSVNAYLTWWVLLPLPVLSVSIYYVSKKINLGNKHIQEQLAVITTQAQETFAGIRILKSFGAEKSFSRDFEREGKEFQKRNLKLAKVNALFFPLMMLLVGVSTILILYIGGMEVKEGRFTAGNVAEFVIYLNMLIWPVASLGWTTALVQKAAASQKRINEFLNYPEYIDQPEQSEFSFNQQLSIRNLSYQYADKSYLSLESVSFDISKSEFLGITGKTGSGKSTLLQLITRQIQSPNNAVLFDDIDVNNFKLSSYRHKIAYVPQEVFLFSDTIEANIVFGVKNYHPETLAEVLKVTRLEKDIALFDQGLNTLLGERGVSLSGGQKQRVSLARALMKQDAEILIMDDCLSAVDAETEAAIIENLKTYCKNYTVIMSSHRIAPLQLANKILVLDQGKIEEYGTHSALLNNHKYYAWLYQNQTHNSDSK